mgnify:CR=1 FL=1
MALTNASVSRVVRIRSLGNGLISVVDPARQRLQVLKPRVGAHEPVRALPSRVSVFR